MNSLFEPNAAKDILTRMSVLHGDSKPSWGKMTPGQMLAHCTVPLKSALGDVHLKQTFFGVVFGKLAKKQILKDEPFKKNLPTDPRFKIRGDRNVDGEKQELQGLVQRFASSDKNEIASRPHPFFGKMAASEWGFLMWKHLDHHLKQFGV